MVQERKEPTLSSIKPERDEIMTHQSRMTKTSNGNPRPPAGPQGKSSGSALGTLAFVLALAGLGLAGFGLWQWQQAEQNLLAMTARVVELEARLNLTNTESGQSVTKILEKLEWADSEIRKLWGVANDTNRKAIASNKDAIAKLDTTLKQLNKELKDAGEAQTTALNATKALTNEQQLVLTQISDDIRTAQQQLNAVADLTKRIKTNEEAIQAIDSFRRTTNAEIQKLKQQQAPPPAGATVTP